MARSPEFHCQYINMQGIATKVALAELPPLCLPPPGKPVLVSFAHTQGTVQMWFAPGEKVSDVLIGVAFYIGRLRPDAIWLSHECRMLEPDRTLAFYGIGHESTVRVNFRLRGGVRPPPATTGVPQPMEAALVDFLGLQAAPYFLASRSTHESQRQLLPLKAALEAKLDAALKKWTDHIDGYVSRRSYSAASFAECLVNRELPGHCPMCGQLLPLHPACRMYAMFMRAISLILAATSLPEKLLTARMLLALRPPWTGSVANDRMHHELDYLQTLLSDVLTWVIAPEPLEWAARLRLSTAMLAQIHHADD
jgi:hypothetical protein